jgi:hypothetical protein
MPEVQDIFNLYSPKFLESYNPSPQQSKAMKDIGNCRSAALGGHMDVCDECGFIHISYNSCRNRHCPKCQALKREQWLLNREQELLDVGYFHIVFTIPDFLNDLAIRNQEIIYNILFRTATESLQQLAADPKYLGANIGVLSVLHTWSQTMLEHPHIHCIVPAGGLSFNGLRWINSSKKFFIPVKALSRKFRGKLLYFLKNSWRNGELKFPGKIAYLENPTNFYALIDHLFRMDWVVYSKEPFASAVHVLRYLGRYTFRVCISNYRIISSNNEMVTFKYRDYRDNNKEKLMTITAIEFIRRFLLHILPPRFIKIRYYGLFSNRIRKIKISLCQKLLNTKIKPLPKLSKLELIVEIFGFDPSICPVCGGPMQRRDFIPSHAPPSIISLKT